MIIYETECDHHHGVLPWYALNIGACIVPLETHILHMWNMSQHKRETEKAISNVRLCTIVWRIICFTLRPRMSATHIHLSSTLTQQCTGHSWPHWKSLLVPLNPHAASDVMKSNTRAHTPSVHALRQHHILACRIQESIEVVTYNCHK